ncbi:MAG TPA: tetratricopeptide repeat protein, partial [Gammaproteobacteria bacterium]
PGRRAQRMQTLRSSAVRPAPVLLELLLLLAFAGAAYLPAFAVPFQFDDLPNIVHNPAVHAEQPADLLRVLDSPVSASRPTALLSFALNHLAGGLEPFGYHAVNLALHAANGLLLYALLWLLAPAGEPLARRLAFFAALLWLLHPVQTQAVTYVVQRMTALATLFYLLGLLVFVLQQRGRLATLPAALLWCAALLLGLGSKEIVATLPLACLLLAACGLPAGRARAVPGRLVAGALLLCAGLALLYLPGLPEWQARYPNRDFSPLERLLTEPRVLWHYLSLLAWPPPERLLLDLAVTPSRGLLQPATTLPALLGVALLAAGGWWLRRRRPLTAFALLFFLLASALEASFVNLELAFVHRLYLPSLFLAAGLLALLPRGGWARANLPLLALAAALACATVLRNHEWRDAGRFWALELERGASPFRALMNHGAALIEFGRAPEAARLLQQSLPLVDGEERALLEFQLASAYFAYAAYAPARSRLEALRDEVGDQPQLLFLLGLTLLKQGALAEAEAVTARLAGLPGAAPQAWLLAALGHAAGGDPELAVAGLEQLRSARPPLDPALAEMVTMQLADVLLTAGRPEQARQVYREAASRRPDNHFAWRQLYRLARDAGDAAEASVIRARLEQLGVALPP